MFQLDGTEETEQGEQMAGHNPYAPTQASLKSAEFGRLILQAAAAMT